MQKKPWETQEGRKIWKSEAKYWDWVRGSLRKLWSDYPVRKEWKATQMRPVTPEERAIKKFHPSTKNVGVCHYCNESFPASRLEVDHVVSSGGCKNKEEAEEFLWYCGGGTGDDWVLACKPCHKVKTYADRMQIDFGEATAIKKAIEVCDNPANYQNDWLSARGIVPAKNGKGRRTQIEDYFKQNIGGQ